MCQKQRPCQVNVALIAARRTASAMKVLANIHAHAPTVPVIAAAGGAMLLGEGVGLGFVLPAALVLGGVLVASR